MAEARRRALIGAALREISDHGSLEVTVAQIAGRAGVSPALAHHYFGGKDDLILATMRHLLAEFRAGLVERGSPAPTARAPGSPPSSAAASARSSSTAPRSAPGSPSTPGRSPRPARPGSCASTSAASTATSCTTLKRLSRADAARIAEGARRAHRRRLSARGAARPSHPAGGRHRHRRGLSRPRARSAR